MVRPDESSPHFQLLQKENDLQYYAQLKEWKSKEKKAEYAVSYVRLA